MGSLRENVVELGDLKQTAEVLVYVLFASCDLFDRKYVTILLDMVW